MQLAIPVDDDTLVKCSTTLNCSGTNLPTMTKRQCCVERDDGLSFMIDGDPKATCRVCIGKHDILTCS